MPKQRKPYAKRIMMKSIEELAKDCGAVNTEYGICMMPEELEAFVKQLRKDAGRYRFLRARDLETISNGGIFAGKTPENIILNEEDLDEAIDKAMEDEES